MRRQAFIIAGIFFFGSASLFGGLSPSEWDFYCRKCHIEINEPAEVSDHGEIMTYTIGYADVRGNPLEEPRVAPVVMTAYPDIQTAAETMRLGCRDYLTKPFREEQLLLAIERVSQEMGLIYTNEQELNRLIGQRIRQERLKQSLTLRQLSERSELTTSQLSQVELGKNAASVWALARISGSLGKQLCELLAGL